MRLLALAAFIACASLTYGAHGATLVHTNDVLGELEPCGCRTNPQGGMARKANFMKRLEDRSLVQLDAGDLLFPTDTVPALLAPQSELQAERLLKAHAMLKHDAIVPGEKDFALGFSVFEKLRKNSGLRFLAANLKRRNGARFLEPNLVLEKMDSKGKKIRIGVFGVVGESLHWPSELAASSAIVAAKEQVKQLKKKSDFVIALTHQGFEKDQELAKKVSGIDVIVGGHTQTFLQKPFREGKTLILQSSFRNQYIGTLPIEISGGDPEHYQLVGLDAGYDSPGEAPSAMDDHVREFKRAVAELNSRQEEAQAASIGRASASSTRQIHTFPKCAECHLKQFDFWRKTQHFHAFRTLLEKEQSKNKDCLSCHTVGLGAKGGFSDVSKLVETENGALPHGEINDLLKSMQALPVREAPSRAVRAWTPVQCENCHGAGGEHPFSGTYSKTVQKELCLKCHTPDRAPAWYTAGNPDWAKIEAKRAAITCPAGELEADTSP